MAENVVSIQFVADDSSTTAAFSKLNAEVSSLSGSGGGGISKAQSAMADWRKETGLTERATIGLNQPIAELRGHVGKTAADFRAATTEQRAASVATEELTQKTHGLIGAYLAYRAAKAVIDVGKYLYNESVEKESSEVRFKNLAGNTPEASAAYEDLKPVQKKTGININELADAETTLREAGVPAKELAADMQSLGDKANVAKKPVGELADLYLRVATRGEVSGRELALVAKLTGDETGKTADSYRRMSIEIPRMVTEIERAHKIEERGRQDEERSFSRRREDENREHSYQQSVMAQATHATGADTAAFRNAGGPAPSVRGNTIKQFAKAYGISEADAEFYMAGQNAGSGLIAKSAAQQEEGKKVLAAQGVNVEGGIAAGEITASDLSSAGQGSTEHKRESGQIEEKRGREDEKLGYERSYQDKITALEVEKDDIKRQLAETVKQGLLAVTPAGEDQAKREGATQAAHDRGAANEIKDSAQGIGDALRAASDWIDGVVKNLTGYDRAAHPVKGSEMPVHEPIAKKPGEPGYDWNQYKPPAGNTKTEAGNNENLIKAITGIVDTLNHIFVSGT